MSTTTRTTCDRCGEPIPDGSLHSYKLSRVEHPITASVRTLELNIPGPGEWDFCTLECLWLWAGDTTAVQMYQARVSL